MKEKDKLIFLSKLASYESCGIPSLFIRETNFEKYSYLAQEKVYDKNLTLFKILLTNYCENNCNYCINRKSRNTIRVKFTPEQLANIFMEEYKRGKVRGIFLSSGVYKTSDYSQERIIETIKILREKFGFNEYIHAKILPNVSEELIYECAKYANRISINLESPDNDILQNVSNKKKDLTKLTNKLSIVADVSKKYNLSLVTQFIVGLGENDKSLLLFANNLYEKFSLSRVYYSRFISVEDTPLEGIPHCSKIREHRLYQADILIRKYKFSIGEIPFDEKGFLFTENDPKTAWAQKHTEFFPVEINTADFETLIRVPGIGIKGAKKIILARKEGKIKTIATIKKLKINVNKVRDYITLDDKPLKKLKENISIESEHYNRPIKRAKDEEGDQLPLWEEI